MMIILIFRDIFKVLIEKFNNFLKYNVRLGALTRINCDITYKYPIYW